jgi:hypothetical protein
MAEALVGLSTTREFYFENLGVPVTGAVLTYTLTGPTGTALVTAAAMTEEGSGWYRYDLTGAQLATAGLYRGRE